MEQNTKKNLIFGGSIAAAALIGLGAGLGIGFGTAGGSNNSSETQLAANVKGIGAFANLESFDNDGFNYGVRKAALEYEEGNTANGEQFTVEEKTSQYSDDGAIYVDMLEDYYATNDIIISAGFQVANALMGVEGSFGGLYTDANGNDTSFANSRSKSIVLMDEDALAQNYTNAASISFAAEGAGYMAGLAAAAYTQYDVESRSETEGNIVMWGGENFPPIISFLAGFEQAINEYNAAETGVHITLWSGGTEGDQTPDGFTSETQKDSEHWYTWGFNADTSTLDGELARTKTINAMNAGASIVFPVAGGNTTVVEDTIAEAGNDRTKIIGVDADATLSAHHPELFLGTAEKNLTVGGQYGLWAMDDFDRDGQRNYEEAMMRGADAYVAQNPEDTYFSTHRDDIVSWHEAGVESIGGAENEVGVILTGTAENGGVGFMLGGETEDLDTTWIEEFATSFGFTTLDEMESGISSIATEATINSTSDTFTK